MRLAPHVAIILVCRSVRVKGCIVYFQRYCSPDVAVENQSYMCVYGCVCMYIFMCVCCLYAGICIHISYICICIFLQNTAQSVIVDLCNVVCRL